MVTLDMVEYFYEECGVGGGEGRGASESELFKFKIEL